MREKRRKELVNMLRIPGEYLVIKMRSSKFAAALAGLAIMAGPGVVQAQFLSFDLGTHPIYAAENQEMSFYMSYIPPLGVTSPIDISALTFHVAFPRDGLFFEQANYDPINGDRDGHPFWGRGDIVFSRSSFGYSNHAYEFFEATVGYSLEPSVPTYVDANESVHLVTLHVNASALKGLPIGTENKPHW